jgi:small subunit ribosomal protein S4e
MLNKLGGEWAPRPSQGPHKLRECLPLTLVLRNRLKYALTRREVMMIVMRKLVKVDHKVRTDVTFPAGFQDVITLDNTGENFRLLYDVKGRFVLKNISPAEAKFKLCRVSNVARAKKASIGRNPFFAGQKGAIPYLTTHDGRTIRYADPDIKVNDTVKVDLTTGKIAGSIKFEVGNLAMITRGANMGRIGVISSIEKHPGSFDIVHCKDKLGHHFATRKNNVFVIGEGSQPWISVPKSMGGEGVKQTIIEERDARNKKKKD